MSFSSVNFLCGSLFRYPFGPCVTDVTWKRPWPAKGTCTLRMWLHIKWHWKLVHGCMVYTECVPRQQRFHVAPAVWSDSAVRAPLQWIFKKKKRKKELHYVLQRRVCARVYAFTRNTRLWLYNYYFWGFNVYIFLKTAGCLHPCWWDTAIQKSLFLSLLLQNLIAVGLLGNRE